MHALTFLADAAAKTGDFGGARRIRDEWSDLHREKDPNDMVVVEVIDEHARLMTQDTYLFMCGKVLDDGEEPPYVGADSEQRERRRGGA